jgi:hypothetical protein
VTDLPSGRSPAAAVEGVHGPGGGDPVERVWTRIRRPIDTPVALGAVVGIPSRIARQVVGATVAGSAPASALLTAMPQLIRDLSISTASAPERHVGQIRGPVLWSETLAARSASAGDPSVFVCATVARAYDTPENRLLAASLAIILRGGRDVERLRRPGRQEPELFTTARRNADSAQRFLEHRTLTNVRRDRVARRALARLHHDPRRRAYRPVVDMLAHAAEPFDAATVRVFCDTRTVALHDLLVAVAGHLTRRGVRLPAFLVTDHALVAGPLRFRHPDHPDGGPDAGISVGSLRLDAAGDHEPLPGAVVIGSRSELVQAVDAAIADLDSG